LTAPSMAPLARSHCLCHQQRLLLPLSMTAFAAVTQLTTTTTRSQWLLFIVDGDNCSHHWRKRRWMAAASMVVFVDGSFRQGRRQWDGGAMTQWHWWQWLLWLMMVAAMVAVVLNCPAAVDAVATIPSLASMAEAKTSLPPPPLTSASIGNGCYCSHQLPPSPWPHS
jgi:hypothetical protein